MRRSSVFLRDAPRSPSSWSSKSRCLPLLTWSAGSFSPSVKIRVVFHHIVQLCNFTLIQRIPIPLLVYFVILITCFAPFVSPYALPDRFAPSPLNHLSLIIHRLPNGGNISVPPLPNFLPNKLRRINCSPRIAPPSANKDLPILLGFLLYAVGILFVIFLKRKNLCSAVYRWQRNTIIGGVEVKFILFSKSAY